ncbi:putative AfsR-family transcriptional regulator [Actinoplanes missouriensis 431]|uniref:Putative AfsR-family transcriptional regulator n=1 Tax=Actinoplanes missouriensis (strain ATCC 14538 / DSM 43046 / CBS 188.64 / JCM 3121 / NBRC 102363 / NCIMB 12654 / NRRL B-3342 / UNCC 431) TaxID=512565 RepID=I0H6V3_ACTM4|nr:BTAD domain-containing putative transcriptional regulator [Actinoplanes missouriensis]BAL88740.1 putative AfsR-family transcriptional regulator [Actinoplanes missouriensis 431]
MRVVLLGPVAVSSDDGEPVGIPGARLRMLLARLALDAGRPVHADTLVDDLWGEQPPSGAVAALQGLVSRLRRVLGGSGSVDFTAGGYRLRARPEDVDAHRFEELAATGRRELAAGRAAEAASALSAAEALWRGTPLADILDAPFARNAATRLDELHAAAVEDRCDAELRLGRHAGVLADLAAAAGERPLSERLAMLRMRALSAAGRQSDALAVYEEIRARLGDELGVDPSADLREVHLSLLRGELERPAAPAVEVTPSRLPADVTSFVGREDELSRIARLLSAARLVTIVGPGGAGKSRLSLEAARRDPAYREGRVWFVPLAALSDPDQLADAVLGVVGSAHGRLYDSGQPAEAIDRLAELLDVGDALLMLDNCEHLVEAAAQLADGLLGRLAQLRILATSREPLAITGEALCHLGPLSLPAGEPDLVTAAEAAAVRLFVDRAAGVRPGFALGETTVDAVVEICWRLDGMPLALELAAVKLRSMDVEQVVRRLDDRFRLLTSGSRAAMPRQRTLLAMVEWSWDLLDEPERVLARRLSVFPGGASLTALEAVCTDARLPVRDVLYVVDSLVEKSLVQQVGGRYRMLETVRAYGAERLVESGDDVTTRFADYFLALAEEQEPLLRTRAQLKAFAVFDAELDNITAALRTALEARDAARTYRFVKALFWYWANRGLNGQLETFLGALSELGDAAPAEAHRAVELVRSAFRAQEVHPARLLWISHQAFAPDAADLGEDRFRQALTAPDPWVRASANWAHNFMLVEQGVLDRGAAAREEALRGFEEAGDRWGLVMSLLAIGRVPSLRGDYPTSIAAFERAVATSAELGTEDYLYWTRNRLARERMRAGDLDGAWRDLRAMQDRAEKLGQRRRSAAILFSVAGWQRRAGDLDAAERTLDLLETRVHRLPYPEQMARDLIAGTRLMNRLAAGAATEARELLPHGVRPSVTRNQSNGLAWAAEQLGELLALEGRPVDAAIALGWSEAIRGAFDHGEPVLTALTEGLVEALGLPEYRRAYQQGARVPRPEALDLLVGHFIEGRGGTPTPTRSSPGR